MKCLKLWFLKTSFLWKDIKLVLKEQIKHVKFEMYVIKESIHAIMQLFVNNAFLWQHLNQLKKN
jgi:hypothetical protein